jgi:hypothetical protein
MGVLTKTAPKAPGEALQEASARREGAITAWRRAVADQTRATAELGRVSSAEPGADRLDQLRRQQALEPARAALLEADVVLERAVRDARAAEVGWQRAFVARHDGAARALFEEVVRTGAAVTAAVEALRAWAEAHDAELLAANVTGDHRQSRPKWHPAVPPWFLSDQGPQASGWDFFIERTREEFGW